jgi:hypothetical protein
MLFRGKHFCVHAGHESAFNLEFLLVEAEIAFVDVVLSGFAASQESCRGARFQ